MKSILTFRLARAICLAGFALLILGSCTKMAPGRPKTIYETISNQEEFSFLTVAVNLAGLKDALNQTDKGALTLFAPDNQAFLAAGFKSYGDLSKVPLDQLKAILLYHVLGSKVKAADIPLAANTAVNTLNGQPLYATRTPAGKVFINGISVVKADIAATNGVIHAIDHILFPAVGTIVATAQSNPDLSLLVAAVLRASQGSTNVAGVLSGNGPFTVFAPTNEAFIKAGFADAAAINAADPGVLTQILTYHVIAGRIFSSDLVNGSTPATVNGGTVKILLGAGAQVKGNKNASPSNIIQTNIVASNGVVHVIDQVLLP